MKTEQRRTTKTVVFERLQDEILNGIFNPGGQLRQEAIARRYGVSLTPVREALMQLEINGLVTFYPNSGATVALLLPEEVKELYEIRFMLEAGAFRHVVCSLTKDHILKARKILQEVGKEKNPARWCQEYVNFHLALYEAARKPKLLELIHMILINLSRYLRPYLSFKGLEAGKSLQEEYAVLLEAAENGEVDKVLEILDSHLSDWSRRICDFMEIQD